jgi:hypothetical protein
MEDAVVEQLMHPTSQESDEECKGASGDIEKPGHGLRVSEMSP